MRLSTISMLVFLLTSSCVKSTIVENSSSPQPPSLQPAVQISQQGKLAADPSIAVDGKGNVYVVWVDHTDASKGRVMLRKFDTDARPSGESVPVSPDGMAAKSWYGDTPTVSVEGKGDVYVGWNRANGEKGNDLVLSTSHDGGATFDAPVKVNDDADPASHGMHSLAVDRSGRIYMAWLDERNVKMPEHAEGNHGAEPNSEVFFSMSDDGGKTFSPNKKLATEVCPCCKTTLLAADNGSVFAAWRQVLPGDYRHIAVASSTDSGESFSEGVIVSDDKWQLHACPVSGAALMMNGPVLNVAWYTAGDEGQAGIYTARSDDSGKTFTPRTLVSNTAASGTPVILRSSEAVSLLFTDKSGSAEIKSVGSGDSHEASIENAMYPAGSASGSDDYVCFVRKSREKSSEKSSSIWLARIGH